MDDEHYMKMALELAEKGRGCTSPNPMVGAVVVKDGTVAGKGWHKAAGLAHAEVNALEDAGESCRDATLYVTLEPCNHYGRTPPCTERILSAGIKRVVIAAEDPNPKVTGGGAAYLRRQGVEVTTGVCSRAAERQNEAFFKFIQTGRPFVVLKWAATLDGRIASRTGDSKWVTGPAARSFVHELRHYADGIMVGIGTVRADNPSLTTRLEGRKGIDPHRIILDSKLSVPEDAKVLQSDSNSDIIIIFNSAGNSGKLERLEKNGVKAVQAPIKDELIDLSAVLDILGGMNITSLLIEGGGRLMGSALRSGIGDKAYFFYAPKILGGSDGVPVCSGPGPESMAECRRLREVEVRRFEDDILISGYL